MRLRKLIKAVDGHKYMVKTYEINDHHILSTKQTEISRSDTEGRMLTGDRYEMQVGDDWMLITPEEFRKWSSKPVKPKTILRKAV